MTCKEKLRELALLSRKKRKWRARADPNSLPLPKGTQSSQGQTLLRGVRWMLRKQWSQVTAREIPAEHNGTTCSGAWQMLQLSPRKTGEPPPLQIQNLTRLPDWPDLPLTMPALRNSFGQVTSRALFWFCQYQRNKKERTVLAECWFFFSLQGQRDSTIYLKASQGPSVSY